MREQRVDATIPESNAIPVFKNATIYLESYPSDELTLILNQSDYVVDRCFSLINQVIEKSQRGVLFFHLMDDVDAEYRAGSGFPFSLGPRKDEEIEDLQETKG